MSDYLSKPVRPEELTEALARWGAQAAAAPAPPTSPAAPQSAVLAEDSMLASLAGSLPDRELRGVVTSFLTDATARSAHHHPGAAARSAAVGARGA